MAVFAAVRRPPLQGRVRQLYRPLNQLYPCFFPVPTGVVVGYGETDDVLRVLEAELSGIRMRIGKPNLVGNVSASNLLIQTPEDPFVESPASVDAIRPSVIDTISPEHSPDWVGTMPSEVDELKRELVEAYEQQRSTTEIVCSNLP